MTFTIGIPQLIWIVLAFIGLVITAAKHGEPKDDCYNFPLSLLLTLLGFGLLYWGGFFG